MSLFYLFLIGILIGTAMIIPGVSGAVIAVIFGVYDKLIDSLMNLFKEFKKNFVFLSVLGTGIILGAIWFSNVLMFLYNRHEVITKFCFGGLILGGIPFLNKEIKQKTNDKINYIVVGVTCFFSFVLLFLSKVKIDLNVISNFSFLEFFFAGIIYSIGKVIPGISSSFLLIIIGKYEFILSFFANPLNAIFNEFNYILPFLLGLVIGIVILVNLLNFLLKKHFTLIYSIIIGFVITSTFSLIPVFCLSIQYIFGLICMIFCFILSCKLTK